MLAGGEVWPILFDTTGCDDYNGGPVGDEIPYFHRGEFFQPIRLACSDWSFCALPLVQLVILRESTASAESEREQGVLLQY